MGFPPVRGDNPQALASGLSYVQVAKHGTTIVKSLLVSSEMVHNNCGLSVGIYNTCE